LEPRDGLPECGPPGSPVRSIELRLLHPAQERFRRNANGAGGVFEISLDQQRRNCLFFLAPEFCAAAGAKAASKASGVRQGSKTEKVLDLLKRSGGASLKELMKATGWMPHSLRGFLSGTISKKMGLKVESTKTESGERSYSVKG
jgi:hypothetical protein